MGISAAPKVDIIWNTTLVCPWDCGECCVDAVQVTKKDGLVVLRSSGLSVVDRIPYRHGDGSAFDQALRHRQQAGHELTLEKKLRVLDNLDGFSPKLDISGGDPLSVQENFELLRAASERFGADQITLTATGAGLARMQTADIAPLIGELNFTYDDPAAAATDCRPAGYAAGNLRRAAEFSRLGVRTRAECPLTMHNTSFELVQALYRALHDAAIDKLLLMRLFPVGRGALRTEDIPTPDTYRRTIAWVRDLEAIYQKPRVTVQCALKFFESRTHAVNPCDMVRESFGLMADGTLLASPWAINASGRPLHDVWVLGNLATTPLRDILASEKAQQLLTRSDENFGHCKIHTFLNSQHPDPMERIFEPVDPLYV